MRSGNLRDSDGIHLSAEKFRTAFAFLCREDLGCLPEGWLQLENGVRASVQHYTTMLGSDLAFETHDRYYDVQYLVQGVEKIGVVGRRGLMEKTPYDPVEDITFYGEPPHSGAVLLQAGDYVILSPQDAHKPRCCVGEPMPVIKIVVKVPVEG